MPRTVRTKVYKFSELSEPAKQKAIETWRNTTANEGDYAWTDEWIDSIKEGLKAFNAELADWEISYDGSSYSSWKIKNHNDNTDELTGIRLRTWLINNYYSVFYQPKHYGEYAKNSSGNYRYKRYSRCQWIETDCPFTGYIGDYAFLDSFRKFIKYPYNTTFAELLENAVSDVIHAMHKDCEWQLSDEYITETIEANDYEFTQDGKRF